jgi:hypothetical protein
MSSHLPPAGTYQPQQPSTLRPDTNRSRANSATAERYRPRTYSNPPPTQPDPTLLGPHQHHYAPPDPSLYPPPPQQQPPYPPDLAYPTTQAPVVPIPMPQPAPSYPNPPNPTPALGTASRRSSYVQPRPPMDYGDDEDGHRHSYSSHHSRHSHDSRRSHGSKGSRHSRGSLDGRYDDKASSHKLDSKREHRHRTNERPTMGDSLVSVFGLIKSALGPRDR